MASANEEKSVHFADSPRYSSAESDGKYSEEDLSVELSELEPREDLESQRLLYDDIDDPEKGTQAQATISEHSQSDQTTPVEYTTSIGKKLAFLSLYFVLNLGVTLSNKALLNHASYPWLLTCSHTTATSIGCLALLATGYVKLSKLCLKDNLVLLAFSVLFTVNIAISNVSLSAVSVPFHQIMRSTAPVITILIYRLVYSRTYSFQTYCSLIPIIAGVGLATLGDYYFTALGFLLTLLGVVLAAVKTVTTNRLMTGSLKLAAPELLLRMAPLAAIQCLLGALLSGELTRLYSSSFGSGDAASHLSVLMAVLGNAFMAFMLNMVSFRANYVVGALSISVAANLKQIITIALGILIFKLQVAIINGIGMLAAVCGAAYYSKVELDRKKASIST